MLLNMFEQNEMLMILNESPYNFHLTGSRFFDGTGSSVNKNIRSDYDFFARNWSEIHSFLESVGFHEQLSFTYSDNNIACVMRYCDDTISIDVQLVNDVMKKVKIQKIINEHFKDIYNNSTKEQRKNLWNSMYQVYDNFQL